MRGHVRDAVASNDVGSIDLFVCFVFKLFPTYSFFFS